MQFPYILIRHAQSKHNQIKRQIKKKLNVEKIKQLPQYLQIKFCSSLKDRSITKKGLQQCQQIQKQLDWQSVQIILVSPLIRCLQTCYQLIKNKTKKCKIIVQPLLASRLASIWSVGTNSLILKERFPQFQFNLDVNEKNWYLKNLTQQKQQLIKQYENPVDGLKGKVFETYEQFKGRLPKIKRILDDNLKKISKNGKILIISHACLLKLITAEKFKQNNKAKGISDFQNANPVYFTNESLFKTLKLNPKL